MANSNFGILAAPELGYFSQQFSTPSSSTFGFSNPNLYGAGTRSAMEETLGRLGIGFTSSGNPNRASLPANTSAGAGWTFNDVLSGLGDIASIGMGIGQLYSGLQNYKLSKQALGLARDQFDFEKGLANRNISNQAKIINNAYDSAAQAAAGMIGSRTADGKYGFTDPTVVKQYEDRARTHHVDGTPL